MVVGDDISVFINNKTGTKAPLFEVPVGLSAKKSFKQIIAGIIVPKRIPGKMTKYPSTPFYILLRSYVNDGGTHPFAARVLKLSGTIRTVGDSLSARTDWEPNTRPNIMVIPMVIA